MNTLIIGGHKIGENQPCFIIAEAGVNHNGNVDTALELVREAKRAGADCVKFQTFKADRVVTQEAPKASYQLKTTDESESQFEMLKSLELSLDDYRMILDECKKEDILFLSTPYSSDDAVFLNDQLQVKAFKIASGQYVELPFLEDVASHGKPLILSTGMCTREEVKATLDFLRDLSFEDIVLLQCTTNYPSEIADSNVRAMNQMGEDFGVIVGYSDHVPNNYACYAAVARGAKVIEKHFTLDKSMKGPDHSSSLDPGEFRDLVNGIRQVELSLGGAVKTPSKAEKENTYGMRRSIVAKENLKAGHIISKNDVEFKRPLNGLSPQYLRDIEGKKIKQDISKDSPIQLDDVE